MAQPVPQPTELIDIEGTCEVLLIRHGRSDDVVPGTPESLDPPLHPEGVEQARKLDLRLESKRIDAVYSSHLARARQTAAPLAARRGLRVMEFEDLEEIRLGDWGRGEFRRRVAVRDPEWLEWTKLRTWDGVPGGEGDSVFRRRVAAIINARVAQHMGQTIAVVAHGGVIGAYLAHTLGIRWSLWMTCENTSITALRVGALGAHIITVNDVHHLFDPVVR